MQGVCYVNVITDILNGKQVPVTTTAPVQQILPDTVDQVLPWDQGIQMVKSGQFTKCEAPS